MSAILSILSDAKNSVTNLLPSLVQTQSALSSGVKVATTTAVAGFTTLQASKIFGVLSQLGSSLASSISGFIPQGVKSFVGAQSDKVTPLLSKAVTFIRPATYVSKLPSNLQPAGAVVATLAEAITLFVAGVYVFTKLYSSKKETEEKPVEPKVTEPKQEPITEPIPANATDLLTQLKTLVDGLKADSDVAEVNGLVTQLEAIQDPLTDAQSELLTQLKSTIANLNPTV